MLIQCRYDEAEQHLTIACEGLSRTSGPESEQYIIAYLWLGWTVEAKGHFHRALAIYESCYNTWTRY